MSHLSVTLMTRNQNDGYESRRPLRPQLESDAALPRKSHALARDATAGVKLLVIGWSKAGICTNTLYKSSVKKKEKRLCIELELEKTSRNKERRVLKSLTEPRRLQSRAGDSG